MKIFTRLSEAIRICAGNVRPYNAIYSLRVSVADELLVALQKNKISGVPKELDCKSLQCIANYTKQLPWLHQQFFVTILKQFINLNQYFHKRKYKLSLKMISIYLTGDVDKFKYETAERMAKQDRQSLINQSKSDLDILVNSFVFTLIKGVTFFFILIGMQ